MSQMQRPPAQAENQSDGELLRQYVAARSTDAFAAIVGRHSAAVYAICLRFLGDEHMAEDAVQATFLVLVQKAGKLAVHSTLGPWLYQTAQNCARECRRAALRRQRREQQTEAMNIQNAGTDPTGAALQEQVNDALQRLPQLQREALVMRYFCGLSHAQIAAQLDCGVDTVESRVRYGLTRLREQFARRGLTLTAVGLTGLLSQEVSAPAGLAQSIVQVCCGHSAASLAAQATAAKVAGAAAAAKVQLLALGAALAFGLGTAVLYCAQTQSQPARTSAPVLPASTVLHVGPGQAYATLQAAADAVQPGQTVLLHAGSYAGFKLSRSGRADAPITFRAEDTALINAPAPGLDDGIFLEQSSDVILDGFRIEGLPGMGIAARRATFAAPMQRLVLRNNRVQRCGGAGIYLSQVRESRIESNEVWETLARDGGGHGISLSNSGSGRTLVCANRLHANAGHGLNINADAGMGGSGTISELTLEANTIFSNGENGLNADGLQDSLIANNLIYNNARHALRLQKLDAAAGSRGLRIVNNSLHVPGSGQCALKLTDAAGRNVCFNNILVSLAAAQPALFVSDTEFRSDFNLLSDRCARSEAQLLSLRDWQRTGQDAHSRLIGEAGAEFRLEDLRPRAGSSAVDMGTSDFEGELAPSNDIRHLRRPQGRAPDAGAHELSLSDD